ncbi:UvrD-helicase domain-containing protein [Endomicrobium proavitum]|uniref:DNA 3'-5' helicase n=1 Tax=Endomicrobium proavitum TaxID=1408281 RepID=A0A0G3WK49_9BACT|nr:UvrD-helicase domain-containing protein [Endomicrobium proavitum]AKL98257.1 RecB-like exodeoxyribonuclease V beta chain [Endomicrobium proavitum]
MKNDKPQITSVQASAGSGKTYNLAKRYITLLLERSDSASPVSIKNVIAVTFANKAAVEMKYRVIEYLKKAALSLDTGDILKDLNLSEKEKSVCSAKILNDILENYDNFNISTIDSFINRILKACAINVGISPNFKIEKDISENLSFSVDSFLKKASKSSSYKNLLSEYIMQYLILEKSGWFPKNDIYNEVKNVFRKTGYTGKNIESVESGFEEGLVSRSVKIRNLTQTFADKYLKLDINGHFKNAVKKVLEEDDKIFHRLKVPKKFSSTELKYNANAARDIAADSLWEEIVSAVSELYEFYAQNYYGVYGKIFSNISVEFDRQAKNEEIVFLNEINRKTTDFFKSADSIMPEVYYRLSERYKHFLVDEFQDTSFVQWSVLKRFLEETLANGGTFFYVGDAKQSIYDFRGGSSEIFYKALQDFPQRESEVITLGENYRSHKTIVDFNNKIFSRENLERYLKEVYEDDNLEIYDNILNVYSSSGQNFNAKKTKGYVDIEVLDGDLSEDAPKLKFLEHVKSALERFLPQDISVLCRTNGEAFEAGAWLLEEGYNVESEQTLNLKNNSLVKQIISLMAFINSPLDALSFASFISGEVFQKAAGISSKECDKFLFEQNKNKKNEVFYKAFQDKYPELWNAYIEEFFLKAGFIPVYELTISVFEKLKIIESFPEDKIFALRFLELVKEFEKEDSGINNFLAYFNLLNANEEILYVKNSSANAIKVMTVHKAKGLQFPVVILPFLKLSEQKIDKPYFDNSGGDIKLLYVSQDTAKFSKKIKNIYDMEKAKLLLSEINVLYVSMTRAECELYAITTQKGRTKNTVAALLGSNVFKDGSKEIYKIKEVKYEKISDDVSGGYKAVSYNLPETDLQAVDCDDAKRYGAMMHFALSKITTLKNKDAKKEISAAADCAKRKFLFDGLKNIPENLESFFENDKIQEIFNFNEREVFNEKEIVTASGDTLRADKLIEKTDAVIVYDFKSSQITEENIRQVEKYKKHLGEIYGQKPVFGFLVEINSKKIVKV